MCDHATSAKHLLNHYLQLTMLKAGLKPDGDTTAEIDQIVDDIVAAAVRETLTRLTRKVP